MAIQQIANANFGAANSLASGALNSIVNADKNLSNSATSLLQLKSQVADSVARDLSKEIDQRNQLNQIEMNRAIQLAKIREQAMASKRQNAIALKNAESLDQYRQGMLKNTERSAKDLNAYRASILAETKRMDDNTIRGNDIKTKLDIFKTIAGNDGIGIGTKNSKSKTSVKGMTSAVDSNGNIVQIPTNVIKKDGTVVPMVTNPKNRQLLLTSMQKQLNEYIDALDAPDTPVTKWSSWMDHTNGDFRVTSKSNLKELSPVLVKIADERKVPVQDLISKMQSTNLAGINDTSMLLLDRSKETLLPEKLFSSDGRFKDTTARNIAAYLYTGYLPKELDNPRGRAILAKYIKNNIPKYKENPTIRMRYEALTGE